MARGVRAFFGGPILKGAWQMRTSTDSSKQIAQAVDRWHWGMMLDERDRRLLTLIQADAETPLADLAEKVALSPSACSRRLARLRSEGFVTGTLAILDREKINLPTTLFLLVRTSRHSEAWLDSFHAAVNRIPEIVEVHRLTGNLDYIIKLVLPNVEYYDTIYKMLIAEVELHDMSAYISMETVKSSSCLPMTHA